MRAPPEAVITTRGRFRSTQRSQARASFCFLGDVVIAEPKALIGFAGPRVIEQTVREKLPEGFQRSEFLQRHGMIDRIVPRAEMKSTLSVVLGHLAGGRA